MTSSNIAFDDDINGFRSTESSPSGSPGISGSAASFYHADLDKVQRKLNGVHVQMYVLHFFVYFFSQTCHNQVCCMYWYLSQAQRTPM